MIEFIGKRNGARVGDRLRKLVIRSRYMAYRILVVEDEFDIRDSFARFLRAQGYEVDEATSFDDARSQIASRTYHVALIDIMLAGPDRKNRDGLKLVDEIRAQDEGTASIVISQQEDAQVAADTLQQQGVYRYVSKVSIEQEGLDLLAHTVQKACVQVKLAPFGWISGRSGDRIPRDCLTYVAGEGERLIISYNRWAHHFGPKVSPHVVEEALGTFISRWAPVLPYKDREEYITLLADPPCLAGTFWSKTLGIAVTLMICPSDAAEAVSSGGTISEIVNSNEIDPDRRYTKGPLVGLVFKRPDLLRSQFADRLQPVRAKN